MPATIRRRRTEMAGHPDRLRGSALFTPFTLVLGLLVLIGGFFLLKRFIFGLGAVTHLSAGYPWGIWVTWDLIIGSALGRSEEHTSELQSLMRISYAVFCLKKKIIDTYKERH